MSELRDISISEFFAKNKHLLGFANPSRALLTAVKEAVDNSLDACEEHGILPEIEVVLEAKGGDVFRVVVTDNGPGIPAEHIPNVFGRLLFGSRFHSQKQHRGQQGIGISAAVLYGFLTTGQPVRIVSKRDKEEAVEVVLQPLLQTNKPKVLSSKTLGWDRPHGVSIELFLRGAVPRRAWSVRKYLELSSVANPHATFKLSDLNGDLLLERLTDTLPAPPRQSPPYPTNLDLGTLMHLVESSTRRSIGSFLRHDLSGISDKVASLLLKKCKIPKRRRLVDLSSDDLERIFYAFSSVRLLPPKLDCMSPIGEHALIDGLSRLMDFKFITAATRKPSSYAGTPFLIEAAVGVPEASENAGIFRFANRVPLLYKTGSCTLTEAAASVDWRAYRAEQQQGQLPEGLVLCCHIVSPYVPFDSEAKEAIADYPEIVKEAKLAFQSCGRSLKTYYTKLHKQAEERRKRNYIMTFVPHIVDALQEILEFDTDEAAELHTALCEILEKTRPEVG